MSHPRRNQSAYKPLKLENKSPTNSDNFEATALSARKEKSKLKLTGIVKKLIAQNTTVTEYENFIITSTLSEMLITTSRKVPLQVPSSKLSPVGRGKYLLPTRVRVLHVDVCQFRITSVCINNQGRGWASIKFFLSYLFRDLGIDQVTMYHAYTQSVSADQQSQALHARGVSTWMGDH